MTQDELKEELGLLRDKTENLLAAGLLCLPPHIHVEGLTGGMKDIQEKLDEILKEIT